MSNFATRGRACAAAAAALTLSLGACTSTNDTAPDSPETSAELSGFYDQELKFGPCDDYATTALDTQLFAIDERTECARLEVPLDYDEPDADTASIAVLRVPAKGEAIGSLVTNPGGPGGQGLAQGAATAAAWKDIEITQRFDVIGMDPRGVGATEPRIECFSGSERDAGEAVTTLQGQAGSWRSSDTRELTTNCAEGSGGEAALAAVGTRDVARDLDILRETLGDDQLTYAGQSYGTRLGTVYAEMFPQNVRALMLDGAADPDLSTAERKISQFEGFGRSFEQMAAFCAKQDECVLGDDPAGASDAFSAIVQPLLDDPAPAGDGRTVDFNGATGAVLAGLFDSGNWEAILQGLAEVEAGDGTTLLALSDAFAGRDPDGTYANYLDANLAINCMDEQRSTPEQETALRERLIEVAPFLDPGPGGTDGGRDACESWPAEPTLGVPYAQDIDENLPGTLTVSITGDPSTPFDAGVSLAERLGGSLLTVEGEQHTVAMSGASACVNDTVADYLVNLEVPKKDASCTIE
ncbi:alpha/beta fold hydrolase [Aeromicrobium sp. CF3.5]|uniref:alpha/beta fold hydrolase n=1 Tax=Aeromicrobium sp. CF3.5 TaxID=3373078 RepID=UPI003EE68C0F